jgi:hypothetical protein
MSAKANRLGNLSAAGREWNPAFALHERLSGLKWIDFVNNFAMWTSPLNHFSKAPMRPRLGWLGQFAAVY